MAHMTRSAPPGFKAPGVSAVLRADKELWMKNANPTSGLTAIQYPLDIVLSKLHTSPEVVFHFFHLLPTRAGTSTKHARSVERSQSPTKPGAGLSEARTRPVRTESKFPKLSSVSRARITCVCATTTICLMVVRTSTHEKDGHLRCVKGAMNALSAVASTQCRLAKSDDKRLPHFSGALSEAVCIEIFCGKARLSKKLRSKGLFFGS